MSNNTMWGGRYAAGPAEIMERINASIDFDRRLYAQDIAGSKAHCRMLVDCKIITAVMILQSTSMRQCAFDPAMSWA